MSALLAESSYRPISRPRSSHLQLVLPDLVALPEAGYFRATFNIPGIRVPEQTFELQKKGNLVQLRNQPEHHHPLVSIEFTVNPQNGIPSIASAAIALAGTTLRDELYYTRYLLALNAAQECFFEFGKSSLKLHFPPLPEDELKNFKGRAAICRKLLFVEQCFTRPGQSFFTLPEGTLDQSEVRAIEFAFRACSEGEFSVRAGSFGIVLNSLDAIDLQEPPFSEPGPFEMLLDEKSQGPVEVFGQRLPLGPMMIQIAHAVLGNSEVIEQLRQKQGVSATLRLVVVDNQIHYKFPKLVSRLSKTPSSRLNFFRKRLAAEEPSEITSLLDLPLEEEVTCEEATKAAGDWLFHGPLPNYFVPKQAQSRDSQTWLIPIWLMDEAKKTGVEQVGEMLIHKKTGEILSHPIIEELLTRLLERTPVSQLPDPEVLKLSKIRALPQDQMRLSELLVLNREGELDEEGEHSLDEMMRRYNLGLLYKSEALKEAVQRGLREPLR